MCAYACARYFELVSVSLSLCACIYAGELSIYPVDTNLEGLSVKCLSLCLGVVSVWVLCDAFCVLVCIASLCAYACASMCTSVCVAVYVFCVLCASKSVLFV